MILEEPKGASGGVPSIIRPDLKIAGDLKSAGDIQIDGKIEGVIEGDLLIVGKQAKAEGTLVGGTVRISGAINGRVRARSVHLDKTARVMADITHEILTIEPGAYFEGQVQPLKPAISGRAIKA